MRDVVTKIAAVAGLCSLAVLASCERAADVASYNLSVAADNFEVMRRIVFINGITDKYLLVVEGLCSLGNKDPDRRLTVTCKTGRNDFKKHFLGLSDNVTFVAEQLEPAKVGAFHYRVMFRPQSILPDIDFDADRSQLPIVGQPPRP
jgi:hypothetical protein